MKQRLVLMFFYMVSFCAGASPCEVALGLASRDAGLGPRGFLGARPGATPAEVEALRDRGILSWHEDVYVVGHVDEIDHQAFVNARRPDLVRAPDSGPDWLAGRRGCKAASWVASAMDRALYITSQNKYPVRPNPLMSGVYAVVPRFRMDFARAGGRLARVAPTLVDRALYVIDVDHRLIRLDPDVVRARFAHAKVSVREAAAQSPPHLEVDGFFYPPVRARVDVDLESLTPTHPLGPEYTFEAYRDEGVVTLEIRRHDPAIEDARVVAVVTGSLANGVLTLESYKSKPDVPVAAKYPVKALRSSLSELGVRTLDLTKVWELHHLVGDAFTTVRDR